MKLFYIVHTRMPTDKAYGLTVVRSCESFAAAGAQVELVMPRMKTKAQGDVFEIYGVERIFKTRYLPIIDAMRIHGGRIGFSLRLMSFYLSALLFVLFKTREDTVIYTRDVPLIYVSRIGFKVVYECHLIPSDRAKFFRRCRHAYRIITISNALKEAFVAEGFDPAIIQVAPSGVNVEIFGKSVDKKNARTELTLPLDANIALYTGNFSTMGQDKGIADIIRSLPEIPEIVFVASGGADQDIARYRSLATECGVADRVLLFGHAPQTTLALYQQAADILLMPFPDTPHYRNHMSPVKMFEYMASGRPIIASDLPTIREVLSEKNAVIVTPGDPHAIAHAMRSLRTDPAYAETLTRQARIDVEQYSWKNRSERIIAFMTN